MISQMLWLKHCVVKVQGSKLCTHHQRGNSHSPYSNCTKTSYVWNTELTPTKTVLLGKVQSYSITLTQLSRKLNRLHHIITAVPELQGLLNEQPLHYTVISARYIDTRTKAIQSQLQANGEPQTKSIQYTISGIHYPIFAISYSEKTNANGAIQSLLAAIGG